MLFMPNKSEQNVFQSALHSSETGMSQSRRSGPHTHCFLFMIFALTVNGPANPSGSSMLLIWERIIHFVNFAGNLSVSWWGSISGSVCSFLFRPEKSNVTLKEKWSSTGLQQTPKTFSVGAFVSLGISSFWPSELPEMVLPLILNPPMSTSFSMFCVTLLALFLSPTPRSCRPCSCCL